MRYRIPSIKEKGGLKVYLDSKKAEHNGLDYQIFETMYKQGVNLTNIGKAFGKRAPAISHWIAIYLEEHTEAQS